jgi:hypothetical protein
MVACLFTNTTLFLIYYGQYNPTSAFDKYHLNLKKKTFNFLMLHFILDIL